MKKINFKWLLLSFILSIASSPHVWADTSSWKIKGTGTNLAGWDGSTAMTHCTTNTAVWYKQVSGTCEFKVVGSTGNWGDNEKNANDNLGNGYGSFDLSNSGGNFRGTPTGSWYICYHTDGRVYGTTTNPEYPDMVIAGSNFGSPAIGDWSTTATVMTSNGSGTYTKTITNVGTSSCEFKIAYKGTWTGAKGYDSKKVTGTNCSSGPSDASGNISFTPAVAGSVTITYVQSTGAITIACPKYSVTYDGNGKTSGSVPTDASSPYNSGSTVTVLGNTGSLAKTGCVFDGWMTAQDGSGTTYAPGATFSITGPTTLYARWIAKTIYVYDNLSWGSMKVYTFESNRNGSWSGTAATSLGSGWYRVDLLDGASKFILNNGSAQTEDITIASYSPTIADGHSYEVYGSDTKKKLRVKQLTVSFDMKSHGDQEDSQSIDYNGLVSEPDAPTADHYTFGGWYKETGCSNAWNFSTDRVTAATTLYAKWTEVTHEVRAQYGTGGSAATPTGWTAMGEVTGGAITATNATGYHFTGWTILDSKGGSFADASSASTTFYPVANDTWVKANFAPNTYDITLDKNGGDSDGSATATYLDDDLASFSTASRAGYTCDGYFDDPDAGEGNMIIDASGNLQLSQTGYTNASGWTKTTTPTTLYAHWTENATEYSLHFAKGTSSTFYISSVSAEKTSDGSAISDNASIVSGTGVTVTATPADHYKIVGWYSAAGCAANTLVSTDNPYSFTMDDDINLYAKAERMTTVITLNANGGGGGSASVTATHGSNTLPSFTAPTRTGYQFNGWYTTAGGGSRVILAGGTTAGSVSGYTDGSGNWIYDESTLTLYAHWTGNNYSVAYNANDAQYPGTASGSMSNSAHTYGTAKNLTSNAYSRSGYDFAGWATTADGDVAYSDGESVSNLTATKNGTVTLYAKWTLSTDYYLACDFVTSTWNNTDVANKFAKDDATGLYTKEVASVGDGAHHFKVCLYNTWDGSFNGANVAGSCTYGTYTEGGSDDGNGGKNIEFTSYATGTVTIVFNPFASPTPTVSITCPEVEHKTIYARNTNNWANGLYIYTWEPELFGSFPGQTGGAYGIFTAPVHTCQGSTTSQWWTVNIYKTTGFLLGNGTGDEDKPHKYQTNDLDYDNFNDGEYWEFGTTGSGNDNDGYKFAFTKYDGTPTKPTVSTTAAGTIKNQTATLGGSITSENHDAVQSYGYYYSTNSALASDNLEVGTRVEVGTGTKTGSYSKSQASLTAGTTYYVMAYASNGFGTGYGSVVNFTTLPLYSVSVVSESETEGTVNTSSVNAGQYQASTTITATANPGYYFTGWDIPSGVTVASGAGTASITINATAASKTITATFAEKWSVAGGDDVDNNSDAMGDWDINTNLLGNVYKYEDVNYAYCNFTSLLPNKMYEFKVVDRSDANNDTKWYGVGVADTAVYYTDPTTFKDLKNGDSGKNVHFHTAGTGTYTITINLDNSDHPIKVQYPTSHTVTFGYGTGGSAVTATVEDATTITTGQYAAAGKDITFAQTAATGYTFKGWYNASSGGSAISCMSSDNVYDDIDGNIEVYAQYTANTYAVTFNATTNGGTLSGSSPKNVTFDATSLASCPVGQKNGYIFDGWYTAATSGKKVINPDGSFVANVTDGTQYTGAGGAWKKATACTVYAVYVAPDTLLLQKPRVDGKRVPIDTLDAKNHPEIDSVIVHHHFAPSAPYGNYNITYKLCYSNHVQLDEQPRIQYGTGVGKVGHDTIWMPMDEIQMYELVAYLRTGSTPGSGDLVTTDTALVSVEKTWPVKVRYIMDGVDLRDATEWPVYPSVRTTEIRIPKENSGYELDHLEYGVGVTSDSAKYINEGATYATYVKAANAATIIAHYKVPANTIYVKRLDANGWYFTSFYVYEYGPDGYWTTGKGSGSKSVAAATQSEHVYRVDDVSMHTISGSSSKMSLTDVPMDDTQDFGTFLYDPGYEITPYMCTPDVIYRTDYNSALPMFVPVAKDYQDTYIMNQNAAKDTLARYYRGFWMRYSPDPDSTGYFLHVYDQKEVVGAKLIQSIPMRLTKTGADGTLELTATMDLEGGKTYGFKYTKATGASTVDWYGESGTMTSTNHTDWLFTTGTNNCGLTTTSAGDYTFHLHCVNYGAKDPNTASATDVQGKMVMTVDYATLNGDFRVVYQDDSQLDLTDGVGVEPIASQSMRARANGQDTVTFYIRKDATNRSMKFQKFNGSTGAWDDVAGGTIALTNTTGQPFTVSKDTTYQIYVQQNADGSSIEATGMDYYSGSYYIRTDCVDEHKWDYKQSLEAHRMVESDYATHLTTDPFTHYYVSWVGANGNVKYVVATQYSPTLTDTLITDAYANVAGGNLPAKGANVRFMYNKKTNTIKRAYLAGAQGGEWFANFLKLSESNDPTGYMQNTDGDAITSITFTDLGNFAYQASIKAKPGLTGKLTAEYNSQTQYFKGSAESSETILGGTGESWQNIIMTYDFKTNRLICAWTPGDTIDETMSINADVMIIRRGKNDAEQIVFKTNGTELQNVKYIYGVIQLDYSDLVGRMYSWDWWAYEHCMYYISFPFDVLVSDITGVGTIGQDWRIQRYNGALRAEKGWFEEDGVKTWWEDVHAGDTLHAYEGYSLLLARTRFNDSSNPIWKNKSYGDKVYLFFPSLNATTGIISNGEVTFTVPAHECKIERPFINPYGEYVSHKISDSHWNMMGMPLFENQTAFSIADGPSYETEYGYSKKLQYLYAWNSAGNTLGIQLTLDEGWEFKTMYSYMVQYTGEVTFHGSTVNKIVAAKREEEKKNYHVKLEISKDEQFIGRTYIELRENAVDSFLLNEDVYMVQNGVNADIYTVAGGCAAAANVLPIANQIVPVGLSVKQAGTYVFSMPSDFDGEVILVDKYAQTRTNLAMEDYETALPTGEITDRFEVEININKVATAIDGTNGDGSLKDGNAHKFIENGMMYILQNGALYDAQGKRVK